LARLRSLGACLLPSALVALAGCNTSAAPGDGSIQTSSPFSNACTDALDSVYATPDPLPTFTDAQRGDVMACALDTTISTGVANESVATNGYTGSRLTTGVTVYRVAYRVGRMASGPGPLDGLTAALVFVPDAVVDANVAIVTAHDTVGVAPSCAPSLSDQTFGKDDTHTLNLAFAAAGYVTIAPDFAGYGYGDPTPGWLLAEDEASSVLDATRAIAGLAPNGVTPSKFVLVGQGQGGHAVLAAQSMAKRYGHAGTIVGVAAFAPIWTAPRTWGADIASTTLATATDGAVMATTLLYFYGHGELYDGPGGGITMFDAAEQQPVRTLLDRYCIDELATQVTTLGATFGDFVDPSFARSIGKCADDATAAACGADPAKTWDARFSADRPDSAPDGAPVVVWQGGADATITTPGAVCGQDKLERDLSATEGALTYCGDDEATHGSVVERDVAWVRTWVAHVASGGPAPAPCDAFAPVDGGGAPITCPTTPPNSD
jgi:alpha-beta hydrolase superfamily lysophospholipase